MKKSKEDKKLHYFFIGTEAELIKLFPVLQQFTLHNLQYKIIASGQNNITDSSVLKQIAPKNIDIILSTVEIKQTPFGLLSWFIQTFFEGIWLLREELSFAKKQHAVFIIHGDTISTVMGAIFAKMYGLKTAHIEAGLRSFNFFQPFPEELDRIIASHFAKIYFCPNDWAISNLKKKNGIKINTVQNTLFDSLRIILKEKVKSELVKKIMKKKYFVFITHRQENIFNKERAEEFMHQLEIMAKEMTGVFVLHAVTKRQLKELGLLNKIKKNKNIILVDRLDYPDFTRLLQHAEFLITDGGSNQEESYYLGKPCLILRSATERIEGLGKNVILSKYDNDAILDFIKNYKKFRRKPLSSSISPSKIIANYFVSL